MRLLVRLRAAAGLAVAELRHHRVRTSLAVGAIALAVLSTTLLASVGAGVLDSGTEMFERSEQDLWITAGPIRFSPGAGGSFENAILDAHRVAEDASTHEGVAVAGALDYQTVYVGSNPSDLSTTIGVGVPNVGGSRLQLESGPGFQESDVHYANGSYAGPMTYEVIIDPRTAALFDVSVGDTLYIGGTVAAARQHAFTVVGISPTFSQFLGAPTVVVHLSELQELAGTTGTDRATMIAVRLEPGADPAAVEQDLQAQFPEYEVRTNREQLESVLQGQALVIASGGTLVVLAVVAGIALTANLLALVVYLQREELAALLAAGVSSGTLLAAVAWQALLLGLLGGILGVLATPPLAAVLNRLAARIVGFEDLVQTPDGVAVAGLAIAVGIGLIGALAAGWQLTRIDPLSQLRP